MIYLYNPFEAEIFSQFLRRIENAQIEEAYLIYFDPCEAEKLGKWTKIHTANWRNDLGRNIAIFHRRFSGVPDVDNGD